MAAAISEIDLYTALRDKLGDSETRDLIAYVKSSHQLTKEDLRSELAAFSTKEEFATHRAAIKDEFSELKRLILEQNAALRLEIATVRTDTERGLKEQLKWLIVLLMGFSSLIITVIKLL